MKCKAFCCKGSQLLNSLRRYSFLGVINLIVGFLAMPLALFFRLQSSAAMSRYQLEEVYQSKVQEVAQHLGSAGMYVYGGFAAVMAFVAAMVLFNYLHQSRQINFYHAQPMNRIQLMTSRVLTALIHFVAPYLINLLLCALVTLPYGVGAAIPWLDILTNLLYCLLVYMVFFSITVFAGQVTGTALAQLEVTGFILLFPYGLSLAVQYLLKVFLSTYSPGPVHTLVEYISPIIYFCGAYTIRTEWILFYGASALILTALNYFLYSRRPLEQAGQAVVWPVVGQLLRLGGGVVVAIGFCVVFGSMAYSSQNLIISIIGMIIGLVLWNMICQVQIFRSFKGAFKGLRSQAVLLAALACLSAVLKADPAGFDTRIPQAGQLAGITIQFDEADARQSLLSTGDGSITFKDPANVETALAMIQEGLVDTQADIYTPQTYVPDTSAVYVSYEYNAWFSVPHVYRIAKNSGTVAKAGQLLQSRELTDALLTAPALLDGSLPDEITVRQNSDSETSLWFSKDNGTMGQAGEVLQSLKKAIAEDLKGNGLDIDASLVCELSFFTEDRSSYTLFIYDTMKQSIRVLEQAGWYFDYTSPSALAEIASLSLQFDGITDKEAVSSDDPTASVTDSRMLTGTDPAWIQQVLKGSSRVLRSDIWFRDVWTNQYTLTLTLQARHSDSWKYLGYLNRNELTFTVQLDPKAMPADLKKIIQ